MFAKVAPGIFCLSNVRLSTGGQSTAFQILQVFQSLTITESQNM